MSNLQLKSGIHTIPENVYHSDPCPEPSLSASLAKTILSKSVHHAWLGHPRFNNSKRDSTSAMNLGSAAHKLILENSGDSFVVIDNLDYRTKAARDSRDMALCSGLIPLLSKEYLVVRDMCDAAKEYLARTEFGSLLNNGKSEQTLIAFNDCWMRGRLDFISDDRTVILDYKTVSRSMNQNDFMGGHLFNMGYDIQAAMYCYLNGVTNGPSDSIYIWLVQESVSPYCCFLVGATPQVIGNGCEKMHLARILWGNALRTGDFNGYETDVVWADVPSWEHSKTNDLIYRLGEE